MYWKDENKEKEAGKDPFFLKKLFHYNWHFKGLNNVALSRLKDCRFESRAAYSKAHLLLVALRFVDGPFGF